MAAYDWLLFFHILGAFLFLSGAITAGIAHFAAMRAARPSEVATLLGIARVSVPLVALGSLLTLVLGLWLAEEAGYGIGDEWVLAALVLWVLAMAAAMPAGRTHRRARQLADRLAGEGDTPSDELGRLVRARDALVLSYASFGLLLAILVLMIWKPGAL